MEATPKRVWALHNDDGDHLGFDWPDGEYPWPPENLGIKYVHLPDELVERVRRHIEEYASPETIPRPLWESEYVSLALNSHFLFRDILAAIDGEE